MLDYFSNDKETVLKKNEKKKKLHELLDKYGSVEEIEKNAIGVDGYEYMFANTDNLINEVLEERRSGQSSLSVVQKDTPQKRNTLLPNDDDFSLEGLNLSERQRKAIKNLDMANQLTMIKALQEQQNVEKLHQKTKSNDLRTDSTPNQYADESHKKQYASNEYAGVKSDAEVEHTKKETHKNKEKLTQDNILTNYLTDEFYQTLGFKESSNDYKKILKDNMGVGAVGRYQFRKPAFQETGYMDKKGNFTGKDGIRSIDDFIQNPEVQEKAVRELLKRNYQYMMRYNVLPLVGSTISGKVKDFKITIPGMLAASHKEGGPMTAKYLKALEKNKNGMYYLPYHKYKGNLLRGFLAIETRLREFSNIGRRD